MVATFTVEGFNVMFVPLNVKFLAWIMSNGGPPPAPEPKSSQMVVTVPQGDKVVVRGQLPPCDTYAWGCQRIMRELAKKTGAIVKYTWRENGIAKSMVFKRLNNGMVEVREFSGGILVNSRSWQSTPLGAGFWLRR